MGKTNNEGRWYSLGIELSENPRYLELEDVVNYYNYPNANGRQMNYGETAEEQAATLAKAQTLVNMPVKAKYALNAQGQPTFKGHEAKQLADGTMAFGTENIGTHTEVRIEERDVVTCDGKQMHLPCLVAKQIIWKSNKNVVAAVKRLFALGKLNTSWEVDVSAYTFKDGIKYLDDYAFLGNAMLGYEYATPAYGKDAKVISLATEDAIMEHDDYELMIAEALSQDMIERQENEVKEEVNTEETVIAEETEEVKGTETTEVESAEEQSEAGEMEAVQPNSDVEQAKEDVAEEEAKEVEADSKTEQAEGEATEASETEQSALTDDDIRRQLWRIGEDKIRACIAFWFPEEHIVWYHRWEDKQTRFVSVEYEVIDDTVVINNPEEIELALPVREVNNALEEQSAKIANLEKQVDELSEYKEKWEASEAASEKAKHDAEVSALRKIAEDAKCFSEEEMAELADKFENLRVADVKAAIFDKKFAVMVEAHEISEVAPRQKIEEKPAPVDKVQTMRSFLHRN